MLRTRLFKAGWAGAGILWFFAGLVWAEPPVQPETETRVYDIQDLIAASDETSPNQSFHMHPVVEHLCTKITEEVGDFDEWSINGGDTSALDELAGNLVVKTSPSNHDAIRELITQMRMAMPPSVAFRRIFDPITYPGEIRPYPIKDQIKPRQWIVHPLHVSNEDDQEVRYTWQEVYEELENLIGESVGEYNDWTRNGGDYSQVDEGPDGLLISTSPANHEQIVRLLRACVPSFNATARFEVRCLIVPEAKLKDMGIKLELKPISEDGERPIGFAYLEPEAAEVLYGKVRGISDASTMTLPSMDVMYREKTYLDWGTQESYLGGYKEVPTVGPDGVVVDEFGGTFVPLIRYYEEGLILAVNVRNIVDDSHIEATIRPTLLNVAQPIPESEWWWGVDNASNPVLAPEVSALDAELTLSIPDGAWFIIDMGRTKGPIGKTDRVDTVAESVERKVLLLVHVKTVDAEAR